MSDSKIHQHNGLDTAGKISVLEEKKKQQKGIKTVSIFVRRLILLPNSLLTIPLEEEVRGWVGKDE